MRSVLLVAHLWLLVALHPTGWRGWRRCFGLQIVQQAGECLLIGVMVFPVGKIADVAAAA